MLNQHFCQAVKLSGNVAQKGYKKCLAVYIDNTREKNFEEHKKISVAQLDVYHLDKFALRSVRGDICSSYLNSRIIK